MGLANEVAIIGFGSTKFGENFTQSYFDMLVEAAYEAYADAEVAPEEIQAGWLGSCYAYAYTTEGNAGTSLAEPLRLFGIPVTRVANYCSTGMDALRNACFAVACGEYDYAIVAGVEKMRDVPPRGSLVSQHVGRGHPLYCKGRTAPGIFALMGNRYFEVYGNSKDAMAQVAVKNHYNGSLNPKAHFQREITVEQALKAPMIADPIGLFDACPTTDGAAVLIITRKELARKLGRPYTMIKAIGMSVANGYFTAQFHQKWDFLGFPATQQAAQMAYRQAGITDPVKEIDVAEVHDCFTITEILNYEDLGFCGRGEGRRFILDGRSTLKGDLPVNTSGGLKSCGHPIGASGVRMVGNIHEQLLGKAGQRQIDARLGLAHTLGGPGAVSCVVILGLPD
ncbi:MAG: acetyl-CoA acetyltransferase [Peptococcaceae bacterium]|nr:MAG: acetyl-CoA acetyltransferase [Peptococcaceae bacterium]